MSLAFQERIGRSRHLCYNSGPSYERRRQTRDEAVLANMDDNSGRRPDRKQARKFFGCIPHCNFGQHFLSFLFCFFLIDNCVQKLLSWYLLEPGQSASRRMVIPRYRSFESGMQPGHPKLFRNYACEINCSSFSVLSLMSYLAISPESDDI